VNNELKPHDGWVVVLVHGTFANDAAWTKLGSALRTSLERAVTVVHMEPFEWGGANRDSGRLAGGHSLATRLADLRVAHPNARQCLVAHSHGGNVALYSLKELLRRDVPRPEALVTFGTPFISFQRRFLQGSYGVVSIALPLAAVIGSALTAFVIAPWALSAFARLADRLNLPPSGATIAVGVPITLIVMGFIPLFAVLWWAARHGARMDSLFARAEAAQAKEYERLHQPPLDSTAVLCVRGRADEAYDLLNTWSQAANVPVWLWGALIRVASLAARPAILLSSFIVLAALGYCGKISNANVAATSDTVLWQAIVTAARAPTWLLVIIVPLSLLLVGIAAVLGALPFGSAGLRRAVLLRRAAEPVPERAENLTMRTYNFDERLYRPAEDVRSSWRDAFRLKLRHSAPYADADVLSELSAWLKEL
jgi:hypothetical protein